MNKANSIGAISQAQFDSLNYSHTIFGCIGPWVTGHPRGNDYGIIELGAYGLDTHLPNGMQEITYTNGDRYYRKAVNGSISRWFKIATATLPEEHTLPLAEGKVGADYNTFRKEQNGRVTLCVSIRRTDGSDLTGFEGAFTLPGGYRPYREEVRRIDLSGADGNPAGYAHLHIYPDGNAGIAGFGTGAKTAFCECGFWTA